MNTKIEQIREIVGKKRPAIVGKNLIDAALTFGVYAPAGIEIADYPLADGVTYLIIALPQDESGDIADGVTEL